MGKPYATEVENLPGTYRFAIDAPIGALARSISGAIGGPLIAVGSGGSLSAAHFAVSLHQARFIQIAKAMTPLEWKAFPLSRRDVSLLLLSAGGGNVDILDAFQSIVSLEPAHVAVLTGSRGSKLAHLAARYRYVEYCELHPPTGGDGFLATNSLLAFCVALTRAYAGTESSSCSLPKDFFGLIGGKRQMNSWRTVCAPLWEREHLIILFPPMLHAAASDLESKFTEAAIGTAHIADYRHFAHGRHHWIAKKADSTGVLAFVTPSVERLASSTIELLPKSVPIARLEFSDDSAITALAALSSAMMIAGFAGAARGIDPGRPGVPEFGRQIYHLRAARERIPKAEAVRESIIRRKSDFPLDGAGPRWNESLRIFAKRLGEARFKSVVFDYDGTLCDARERFAGLGKEVAENLTALLRSNIPIGIATGRGKSAKRDLRAVLPEKLWPRVVVGYYNGFETALLSDETVPGRQMPSRELRRLSAELRAHPFISKHATCDVRAGQISLTPAVSVAPKVLWQIVADVVLERNFRVVLSSHAVDVTAAEVSKLTVLERIRELFGLAGGDAILCIGDRGRPPGNDSLLLARPHALSVHEVSADPESCWNLAPPGHRGVQALLDYFKAFRIKNGQIRVAAHTLIGGGF